MDPMLQVVDLIMMDRRWDVNLLNELLCDKDKRCIMSIPIPLIPGEDHLVWHHSKIWYGIILRLAFTLSKRGTSWVQKLKRMFHHQA